MVEWHACFCVSTNQLLVNYIKSEKYYTLIMKMKNYVIRNFIYVALSVMNPTIPLFSFLSLKASVPLIGVLRYPLTSIRNEVH